MGLDLSHGPYTSSYGTFNRLREAIAFEIGLLLNDMQGFGGKKLWPEKEVEPLVIFLNHSDCDGQIEVIDLQPLQSRLEQIAPRLKDDYYQELCLDFAQSCAEALKCQEPLEFC